ncbi:MAG: Gfo/Idh/MocA family oxidoreductase [Gemmataceae bacterium]|nr:Gfo/Idh/MocA family oxidoreductase [Gemmataceae bacterium]
MKTVVFLSAFLGAAIMLGPTSAADEKLIRIGIIGCDTSHVPAFTALFNDPKNEGDLAGMKVVAAYPAGTDIPESKNRVQMFTDQIRKQWGVEIVGSIEELLTKVDVVLLESVDGRPHLEQALPVFKARKKIFIDKPIAASLADVLKLFALAKETGTPMFSSSSLRYYPNFRHLRTESKVGKVVGCVVYGPCSLEPHHPDLFWYGVHGVETLYTIMGTGCKSVVRTHTPGTDVVTGTWADGRVATFRGIRAGKAGYGALLFGDKGIEHVGSGGGTYKPLVVEIAKFFRTGVPPVAAEETIEMFAFMEAADESKRQGGAPVLLETVLAKARAAR